MRIRAYTNAIALLHANADTPYSHRHLFPYYAGKNPDSAFSAPDCLRIHGYGAIRCGSRRCGNAKSFA